MAKYLWLNLIAKAIQTCPQIYPQAKDNEL